MMVMVIVVHQEHRQALELEASESPPEEAKQRLVTWQRAQLGAFLEGQVWINQ